MDQDESVRSEAVRVLGQVLKRDNQIGINAVFARLTDTCAETRLSAAHALDQIAQQGGITSIGFTASGCTDLSTLFEVGKTLAHLSNLTTLNLNFSSCYSLTTVDEVWKGI